MNAVIEAIKGRRSVRSYEERPVPRELIEAIIDAGNWAPGGCNQQRWRFVVVQDNEFTHRLKDAALPTLTKVVSAWMNTEDAFLREYFTDFGPRCFGWRPRSFEETMAAILEVPDSVYWGAPVIIFVIGPHAAECSLVCENMMVAAHSLGLGSCIVGFGAQVMDDPEIVAALEIEGAEKIHGPIVIGYPKVWPAPPPKEGPVVKWV